jgi:prepilin-type processing-associated H-X9-DG protein
LIETLVVTGIITLLMAITIPAILRVRAASDKLHCANNLRQIGIALQAFEVDHKRLPPGCSYEGDKSPQPHMSWLTRILPFIERDQLWVEAQAAYAKDPWFEAIPPHYGLMTIVKDYVCPLDDRSLQPPQFAAMTCYLGVSGTNQFKKDGMLFLNSKTRISDAKDGTSHTLLVGERPPSADLTLGWWYAGWGQDKDGSGEMILGVREHNVGKYYKTSAPLGPYEYGPGQIDDPSSAFHFWSLHSGGAHFVFCDGSVRLVRYTANPIMPALATRRGNESVDMSELE